jgi:hypothetical protein
MPGFSLNKKIFSFVLIFSTGLIGYGVFNGLSNPEIDFNTQIRPILNKNCITCHGGVKRSGGFSLLFPSEALEPNESGKPAIIPGNPRESEMIHRIKHHDPEIRMPQDGDPLSKEEIELITQWIKQGAKWQDHWAYVKPEPVDVPDVSSKWIKNDIDRFVLQKLEENKLKPSPMADKTTLLRRVSLDLTGLPPTTLELQQFLADESAQAYEKVVDRLLASPHYGERWTAMWMDLARYADSKGYEKDGPRTIWPYRDWLIKAFNEDKPYDQFVIEQLAGDLLPNPSNDLLIATAFHRNTMNNDEGGTDDEEFRVAAVIDRVNTTWKVLQATTMECVQCHSHPYDPVRHEDYFKSYAFFNNTADEDVPDESPVLKIFTNEIDEEHLEKIKLWVAEHTPSEIEKSQKIAEFANLIKITSPKIHPLSFDQITKGALLDNKYLAVEDGGHSRLKGVTLNNENRMMVRYRSNRNTGRVEMRIGNPEGKLLGIWDLKKNKSDNKWETITIPIVPMSGIHDVHFMFKDPGEQGYVCTIEWVLFHEGLPGEQEKGYNVIKDKFLALLNSNEVIATPVMVEYKEGYRRKTHIFERGNWMVHGDEVEPGVPQAWNPLPEGAPLNRLGMAQWLVSKDNPLAARVMVNRLWAQLFGTGIVETLEDFGSQGFAPSHPELLDWLAQQFMHQHNWSIKKQLKQIVMSAVYQQSSRIAPELLEKDPRNYLLARGPRVRLSSEQIRDQALAVSGLLSNKMYGASVMPPQPEGLWQVVYSGLKWITSEGEDKYRRALYTFWRRTNPYPSLVTFDSPSREFCVTRRYNTNTPLQALVTLNDPVYMEAAQALAQRMKENGRVEDQITNGYRMAMIKEIDAQKLQTLKRLYEEALQHFKDDPNSIKEFTGENDIDLAALTVVANTIMNLDEFLTK